MSYDTSNLEGIPEWMKEASPRLYPSINCLHIQSESFELALTQHGLERFADYFSSFDSVHRFIQDLQKGEILRKDMLDVVVKKEYKKGSSIPTLLTLAALAKALPEKTSDYIFQPIDLYFAISSSDVNILVTEKVNGLDAKTAGRNAINAYRTIINKSREAKLPVDATLNDVLIRGYNKERKIQIALIDVQSPGIDTFLGNI